jgi:hypothetical protein
MKKSHECEVATHIGAESCGVAREGGVEALTGERTGRVFSRLRHPLRDADAVGRCGRPRPLHRYREVQRSPARSETPCTYGTTSLGNREIPVRPRLKWPWDASGCLRTNADDERTWEVGQPSSDLGATPLLKTIPASCETSDLLEFAFGPEPIVTVSRNFLRPRSTRDFAAATDTPII